MCFILQSLLCTLYGIVLLYTGPGPLSSAVENLRPPQRGKRRVFHRICPFQRRKGVSFPPFPPGFQQFQRGELFYAVDNSPGNIRTVKRRRARFAGRAAREESKKVPRAGTTRGNRKNPRPRAVRVEKKRSPGPCRPGEKVYLRRWLMNSAQLIIRKNTAMAATTSRNSS